MTSCKQIEVHFEDPNPQKWCHPLKEDGFAALMIFGSGSFFSPLLFGKFFDPSDAFPLWEFEPDVLLPNPNGSGRGVDWFQTEAEYVLKAEVPGLGNNTIQVCVVNGGGVLEMSGQWKQQKDSNTKEWKSSRWWEHGYVRRIELPERTDWRKVEAHLNNDVLLEIKIPKIPPDSMAQGS